MPSRDPALFLNSRDRESLERACRMWNIPSHLWRRVPILQQQYENAAVEAEVERILAERPNCKLGTARSLACSRVGVAYGTYRGRKNDVTRYSLDPARDPADEFVGNPDTREKRGRVA